MNQGSVSDQGTQSPLPSPTRHLSLPASLCAVMKEAGSEIDLDEISAAMGLPFLLTAVTDEPDLGKWMLYGRDAFLIPAARLFGMTIRELHPPEAARGLSDSAEFGQHFDISYKPLILRALEHDQPVIAWRGWPGDAGMQWGLINGTCDDGVGLRGRVIDPVAGSTDYVLQSPPVQCYVVERIVHQSPTPRELLDFAIKNGQAILENELCNHPGVTTGPEFYDQWLARVKAAIDGKPDGQFIEAHRSLALTAAESRSELIRFLSHAKFLDLLAENQGAGKLDFFANLDVISLRVLAGDNVLNECRGTGKITEAISEPFHVLKGFVEASLEVLRKWNTH